MTASKQVTISKLVQYLKGKTAHKVVLQYPHVKTHYLGQHMWARGCFRCSTSGVANEMVAE